MKSRFKICEVLSWLFKITEVDSVNTARGISMGRLYNAYSLEGLAPSGWHIPSLDEFNTLVSFLGGSSVAAGPLKSTSALWNSPNTGATNSSGFSSLPSGVRNSDGSFGNIGNYWLMWTVTPVINSTTANQCVYANNVSEGMGGFGYDKRGGMAVRLVRDDSNGWIEGEQLTDEDGNKYDTVQIGTQIWTVQNWACTKYANGDTIPDVTDAAEWEVLDSGAFCNYENSEDNVFSEAGANLLLPARWKFRIMELFSGISTWKFRILEISMDTRAPRMYSATMLTSSICVLAFDEELKEVSPDPVDFVFDNHDIDSVELVDDTVILYLATPVVYGETSSVSYIPGNLQDATGNMVEAFTEEVIIDLFPDGASSNLSLSATENDVTLTWENSSTNETGITIERSTDGITFSQIATTGPGVETFLDENLEDGTYYYRVRAELSGYFSDYSNVDEVEVSTIPPYEAETISLLSAMDVQPTPALADLINITIKGLKDDGVFSKADAMYIRGLHTSQAACLNWIKRAHDCTLVNSPTFTQKVGFQGNLTDRYIDTNFKPSVDGINFKLGSATLAYRPAVSKPNNTRVTLGAAKSAGGWGISWIQNYTANDSVGLNNGTSYYTGLNTNVGDISSFTRNSGVITGYKNGSKVSDVSIAATGLPSFNIYELAYNAAGSAGAFNATTLTFSFYGAALDDTESNALYNRIKHFFDNVNATF